MRKRIISLVTVISVIIGMQVMPQNVPENKAYAVSTTEYENGVKVGGYHYYKEGIPGMEEAYELIKDSLPKIPPGNTIPPPTRTINGITYGINFTLWYAKRILVYGDPTLPGVNPRVSGSGGYVDFKPEQQYPSGSAYYLFNGQRGEFRYHGFDYAGNRYNNTQFPPDTATSAINSYSWLYRPWDISSSLGHASPWNLAAIESDNDQKSGTIPSPADEHAYTQYLAGLKNKEIIQRMYKDEPDPDPSNPFSQYTFLTFENTSYGYGRDGAGKPTSRNAFDYANVMSPPTYKYPGEARLWHEPVKGGYRYRTTFIEPVGGNVKLNPDLAVTATVQNPEVLVGIKDFGEDNTPEYLNTTIDVKIKVTGTLLDEDYINDPAMALAFRTRFDMANGTDAWSLSLSGSEEDTMNVPRSNNTGTYVFTKRVKVEEIITALRTGQSKITLNATAKANFQKGEPLSKSTTVDLIFDGVQVKIPSPTPTPSAEPSPSPSPPEEPSPSPTPTPLPQWVEPDVDLPEPAFDIVPYTPVDYTDITETAIVDRKVYVDGEEVDYDYFFSGNYVFGAVGYDRLANIQIHYISDEGNISLESRWIRVLNTKPRVQFDFSGDYKQNRRMTAINTSLAANTPIVLSTYPINSYAWTVESLDGNEWAIKTGTATDMLREFTFKEAGAYRVTLTGTNTLGRTSDPYVLEFHISPDTPAAVICELDNVAVARGETVRAFAFEAVSTDGDEVETTDVYLYYDSDNDGSPETLLEKWSNVENGKFPEYAPANLGMYRFRIVSKERIMGDVIPAHISVSDATVKEIVRDFWCDNYAPQTGIYVDIPIVRPNIDVFIMMDANLNQSKTDYIKNNRMNFNNYLRANNIIPVVECWDMKTYTYSQPASTTRNYGTSYPPSSIYYSSGGYSGTLTRTSVTDNGSYQDFGHWETKIETHTETRYFTASNTVTVRIWGRTNPTVTDGESNPGTPSTWPINEDGYVGSIPRTTTDKISSNWTYGASYYDPVTETYRQPWESVSIYRCNYGGTLSKTVSEEVKYWVSDWRWVSDYYGHYSGTIYKDVREPYVSPWRSISKKYIIYVSDGNIAELSDLQNVVAQSGAELILVTGSGATSQTPYRHFILNNRPIADVMAEALSYIAENSPAVEGLYVLCGIDTFNITNDDFDQEGDPIVWAKYQYVQDMNWFDNPLGMESYTVAEYSDDDGWVDIVADRFTKPGKYTIYRRIQDRPGTDPAFEHFSYYSGLQMLVIFAHRKPVASCTLDWDYKPDTGKYITTWVDNSYDLDHQYSRPDKGIVDRSIMFRRSGGPWQYYIPEELTPGTYELQYSVMDPEGVWSDPYIMNFTLNPVPPMQFDASLRALDSSFSLNGIPAREYLEAFDLWTRYPYNVHLEMALYSGSARVAPLTVVTYSPATGTKTGNDIIWNNISYQIPATLKNGSYTCRIAAAGDYGQTAYKEFPVRIETPIDLRGYINGKESGAQVQAGSINHFTFQTSKYVEEVRLNFKGQVYSSSTGDILLMDSNGDNKRWEIQIHVADESVMDGETGFASFTAILPSGESQTVNVDYHVVAVRAFDFTITSILDMNWRGYYFDIDNPINGDGNKYGYPAKSNTEIKTDRMPINTSSNPIPYSTDGVNILQSVKAGCKVKGYIRAAGNPDWVSFIARYPINGIEQTLTILTEFVGGNKYEFEWIIPGETDQDSLVRFDVEMRKGNRWYNSDKWMDTWAYGNENRAVFHVKGNVMDDIMFIQSN